MKILKLIIVIIVVGGVVAYGGYLLVNADQMQFESVCKEGHKRYTKLCKNVGKYAWTQKSVANVNEKNYGKIIGVAWRKKGSVISSRNQKKKRRSEKNTYYYIVGDIKDWGSQFLMVVDQIEPRK